MRHLRFVSLFWAFSLILTASFGLALAGEYTNIDGTPAAINAWGVIAGYGCFHTPQCSSEGVTLFLYNKGTYSVLSFPPSISNIGGVGVSGINAWGDIVGTYLDNNLGVH